MKLQTKLLLALLAGLLSVYAGSCLVQRYFNLGAIQKFSRQSRAGEEARQWEWVESLHHAIDGPLMDAMNEGDMDKFAKLLAEQRQVSALQDISLYSREGRVTHSSDPGRIKKDLPAELKQQLLSSGQIVKRRTETSFEFYEPQRAEKSCLQCHVNWRQNDLAGVLSMRISSEVLKQAEQSWAAFEGDFSHSNSITTSATAVVLTVVVTLLVAVSLHFLMSVPLKNVAAVLSEHAAEVSAAAAAVGDTGQSLAEGASQQAAALEETSASLEEISSTTKSNAQTAHSANEFTAQTRKTAEAGVQGTTDMNRAMDGIRSASSEMLAAMNGIKAASGDVSKIIKTIDEIAFQTNILALNAAVEAARAGEAGLGFAVVADEVRNLAQRSAKAAKETADMIDNSIRRSEEGVRVTEKVTSSVQEVAAKSKQIEARLAEISTQARQVDEQVAQIASASAEQSQSISQVSVAVSQVDKVTQSNAASAEESAAAAEQLNAQAVAMKQAVADLLKLVDGANAAVAQPANVHAVPTTQPPPAVKRTTTPAIRKGEAKSRAADPTPFAAVAARRSEAPLESDFKNF